MDLKGSCYESCKNVKYSLNLLENSPIDKLDLDKYGEEFKNYIFKPERVNAYMFMGYPYKENFLDKRYQ